MLWFLTPKEFRLCPSPAGGGFLLGGGANGLCFCNYRFDVALFPARHTADFQGVPDGAIRSPTPDSGDTASKCRRGLFYIKKGVIWDSSHFNTSRLIVVDCDVLS